MTGPMAMAGLPICLVLLRGCHDTAILFLLGALAFTPCALARALAPRMARQLCRLARISGALALVLGTFWFLAEAALVADAHGMVATLSAVPAFVVYLPFAQVLLARLVLIAVALALLRRPLTALAPAAVAVAMQPWLGHAAQVGTGLAASEVLHLLAAGVWLGGLVPLLLCLRALPLHDAARTYHRFTLPGLTAVLILAGTGLTQGLTLSSGAVGLIRYDLWPHRAAEDRAVRVGAGVRRPKWAVSDTTAATIGARFQETERFRRDRGPDRHRHHPRGGLARKRCPRVGMGRRYPHAIPGSCFMAFIRHWE